MTEDMADVISHASTMHDVGKITVPDSILLKPGKLTREEFELMKTHTSKGAEIIREIFVTDNMIFKEYCYNIALSHHEKWDGKGYPQGLKEDEIPLAAQVVSIADVYDALVSDRVYKPAFSYDVAYQMILDGECGQFNPKLMDCFRMARKEFEQKAKELQWQNERLMMKRILLKLSGEALAGEKKTGFDEGTVRKVALQIKQLTENNIQVGVVIGGGNFWRGRTSENIDRTKADQIGMLATIMNCIYVSEICRAEGMQTAVLTPFECGTFTKLFSKDRANKYFEKGMVVFFAGGTGHPYFSTDTGVVLRAIEVEAEVILLAKAIDGVYNDDPRTNPKAEKYTEVSIDEVIEKNLQVVDMTASILARDNKMPMWVFGLNEENSIVNTVNGKFNGTKVTV